MKYIKENKVNRKNIRRTNYYISRNMRHLVEDDKTRKVNLIMPPEVKTYRGIILLFSSLETNF